MRERRHVQAKTLGFTLTHTHTRLPLAAVLRQEDRLMLW